MWRKLRVNYAVLITALLLAGHVALAGVFPVTNGNNAGAGSLRQAILDANAAGAGPHNITFSVAGVIGITTSLPAITVSGVTIDGGGTVIISGPAPTNNTVTLFLLNTGANNTTIKGMTLQNTGVQAITINGALSGVTLEDLSLRQTGLDYFNYGIYVGAASTNLTIRNVNMTDLEKGTLWGIRFVSTVSGLNIEGLRIYNSAANHLSAANDLRGIQFEGTVTNSAIRNSTIDLNAPGSTDDGNYGIYFNTTVNGFVMDSVQIHDAENYHMFFGAGASNVEIKNSIFDNFNGSGTTQLLRFNSNVNIINIDNCIFNADQNGTADDGNGAIWFNGNMQRVDILNSTFTEADTDGIYAFGGLNNDFITISGNTFLRIGSGTISGGVHLTHVRNTTSDGGPVLISDNIFRDINGVGIYVRPNNTTSYVIPNLTIRNNTITGSKVYGGIKVNYIDKIIVTQNSIYNNLGRGLDLTDNSVANCGYEGANIPQLLSSGQTAPGVYTITVKMPALCGTNACSLELFSNEAGVKGNGGQHYVQLVTGLGQGNRTITGVTGPFAEITAAPYGTWTATLRAAVNCGTSEFSNKIPIKVNGPAGVDLGIKLWLRGDDIAVNGAEPTADGQVITGWEEFSGGGGPSAYTIINNPVVRLGRINFNPVADMDGDVIRGVISGAPSWITNNTTTTVAVFNPLSASASGDRYFVLFSQAGWDYNTNQAQIEFYRTGNNINSYRGSNLLAPAIPGITGVSAFNKVGVFTSATTGTNHTGYYNGANMGSGNYSKGNFGISQWFIGGGWGPDANGRGAWQYAAETDFAEVFTYNRALDPLELQRVQSYMALKYGIAMKQNYVLSNGTLVWNVTTNATWSKEIAALTRDNLSILHQKQAKAFHADEVVSIGLGSELATTNKENEGNIPNDLSLLIWGNDSASTAYTQPFTAGTFSTNRMPRVWKVQKLNWSEQDITIQVKNAKDNNYLLISTDPTFNTITQELKLSKTGSVTLSSSILANGAYFSFGREQKKPGGVLPGLSVWVKGDAGVNRSGTNAITWEDQAPSQRTWPKMNTNALTWNSAAMNYNPAIVFTGQTGNYFRSDPPFTNAFTQGEAFSVQSSTVNNVAGFPWHLGGTSGSTLIHYRWTDDNMYLHFGTNARRNFSFGTKNMALPVLLNVSSAANSWNASLDGRSYHTAAYPTSFAQAGTGNAIGVGYGSYFNGPISEVILYNRKLDPTERQQVNSYMALKYGLTLEQVTPTNYLASDGTTTIWNAANNAGFNANIAGIGRDENGSLYQKQSRSINTAASGNLIAVTVGGELALSNEANTDSIENDKSFLVWADNNGAIAYTTNVTGGHVTLRMPRVWKVDKTNWNDKNITIKLYGSARNTYLIINNTDATFATIQQEIAVNPDSTITINSNLLPDGAYFTFAKELTGPSYVNSSIVTWQRADDGVSASDAWYDFSGNGNDATQTVVADQPGIISGASDTAINFNPGFKFKTTAEWFDYSNNLTLSGTGNKTVLWVAKSVATTGTSQAVLSHSATGSNLFVGFHDVNNRPTIGVGGGGSTCTGTSPSAVPFGTPLIGAFNRASVTSATTYTNGAFPITATCNTNFVGQNMRIGARSSNQFDAFNGSIAEVIVYNRSLAAFEMQRVHSYLALKYGISLPQTTPTDYVATDWDGTTGTKMWTNSKNAGYGFRIAGIGRDDLTKLFQKQSRSAEPNSIITIAAGASIATDNLSNSASMDDMTFFTWSDNNLATTFGTVVTGVPNATFRMARVWKVDRTNWGDQDITLQADKIGVRYLLVNATDPTFGAGTVEYVINTTNSTVTLNTSNLPDGAYFTLATKIVGPGCVNNGIQTWLRADYNATPAVWNDFSGNQANATQVATASQAALTESAVNFLPALTFNNGAAYMDFTGNLSISGTSAFTVIGLGTRKAAANWDAFLAQQTTTAGGFLFGFDGTNKGALHRSTTGNTITGAFNYTQLNTPFVVTGTRSGNNFALYKNGGADGTVTSTHVYNSNAMRLGNRLTSADVAFNGHVPEMIVYNRALDNTELQKVHSYLSLKYGVTLDQTVATDYVASDWNGATGTKMWTAADNTGYNFRITGIGRDDCDDLYQKQSRNQDGGLVTLGIGGILASTNAANTDSIVTNNSYFVFADNNLDTLFSTEITATGLTPTMRMPRIWKVDRTNWADADIVIKYGRNASGVFLLASTDPTFATGVQEFALNADDSTVSFVSDVLPDGAYFTFAKEVYGPGYVNNGIMMWLRADDAVATVDNWNDYSGGDKHALQATVANQPALATSSVNYNPGFTFNGTGTWMATNTSPATSFLANSYFAVNKPSIVTGQRDYLSAAASATSVMEFRQNAATFEYGEANAPVFVISPAGAVTLNTPFLAGLTQTTGAGNVHLYKNGVNLTTGTIALNMPNAAATFELGRRHSIFGANFYFQGDMNEVVAYNRVLTASEQERVNSYLSLKYGITLNSGNSNYVATDWDGTTGTVYWTTEANYKNNIAGIGRDDKTGLLQKQSRSINSASNGNMVAIGLESLAATNKENTGSFTDDLSFLVWADNGLAGTLSGNVLTAEVPSELDANGCSKITRLQREWKVQETGTVGFVQLQFFLTTALAPSSATISDFSLLLDDDGDFSNGGSSIVTPAVYDAATRTVTFENVDFVNGQYFTLVTDITNEAPGGVLTNLYTWYRADKGVNTATGVSQWLDQSTSLQNIAQATGGAQPVYNTATPLINFNPTLSFAGTDDVLAKAAISHSAATAGEEIFAVVLPANATGIQNIVGLGNSVSTTTELRYNAGRLQYLATSGGLLYTTATNGAVQLANANRTSGGAGSLVLNGTAVIAGTVAGTPALDYLNIGAKRLNAVNSQFYTGQVAEVAIYNRQLLPLEREKVASYLAVKYGITLPHNYTNPNGTVVWDQSLHTGYANNITGIGRDDCNGLHQKQSRSVNAGAMVTLASGTEVSPSNAANLNTLENNTALLFGDNNAAVNTWTNTEAPAGRNRVAREWKVQVTGTVGTVTVQVPANTSTATPKLPAEINKIYLLVDADGDFSSGAEEIQMQLNGTNYEASYEFNGNAYFTFATANNFLSLTSKVILQGAWDGAAMRTDLKTAGVLPATDPYGLNTTPSVTPVATPAQVVDWVRVELRDATDPTVIVTSRAAFVLANGNIVDTNYAQPLSFFGVDAGNYIVAVRHRNHLGVMSLGAVDFSSGAASIDFSISTTATYGINAQKELGGGITGLWAGDVTGDGWIRHSAKPSDASMTANAVLTHAGNSSASPAYTGFINAYSPFDVNLDARVYYTASPSDHSIITNNVKTHPANTFGLTTFGIKQQIP